MSIRIHSGVRGNDPIIGGISISISIIHIHIQQRMGSAPFWERVRGGRGTLETRVEAGDWRFVSSKNLVVVTLSLPVQKLRRCSENINLTHLGGGHISQFSRA